MFSGSAPLLLAMVVLAMLSAGGVAYALLYGRISGETQRHKRVVQIQARSSTMALAKSRASNEPARRRKSVQDSLKEMEERQKAKARRSQRPPLALRMEQAGLTWSKRTYFLISGGIGLALFLVPLLFGLPAYATLAFGVAGAVVVPRYIVSYMRKRRFKAFLEEFPNAVDVIVRGIKAGLPLNDCLRIISVEAREPVQSEFRAVIDAQNAGLTIPEAVARMPERIPLAEANFFSIVITIQAKSGGNLSEALGNLSKVLRERRKMKGKILAMSMEAKASAAIIGALPVIVAILTYLSSPDYISLLFTDPVGNIILVASGLWMGLGVYVMRTMINFDY